MTRRPSPVPPRAGTWLAHDNASKCVFVLVSDHTTSMHHHVSRVNSLPADILEDIFLTCVFWDSTRISPLVLTAVCRPWRQVALHLGRLWDDIDMSKPALAKYFVQLSRGASLDITWCERKPPSRQDALADNIRWLSSQAYRFRVLAIHSDKLRRAIVRIRTFMRSGRELPRLQALIFNATDEAGILSRPTFGIKLDVRMPLLRHLSLWNLKIRASDLLALCENSVHLETVLLAAIQLEISESTEATRSDIHPISLQSMRRFHLKGADPSMQAFVLARMRFPDLSLFTISDYVALYPGEVHGWRTVTTLLHPSLFTTINPCFTYCRSNGRFAEVLEDAPFQRVHMQLKVQINTNTVHFASVAIGNAPYLFSDVRVLELDTTWPQMWRYLSRYCPAVETLILRSHPNYHGSLESFPILKEIRLLDVPFNLPWRGVYDDATWREPLGNRVIAQIRKRNKVCADMGITPIRRLVLYACKPIDEHMLAIVREEMTVELLAREEYENWESALRHRALADLRSVPSWLPRSASACTACNGHLEEYAEEERNEEYETWGQDGFQLWG